jgi:hypothetical protein
MAGPRGTGKRRVTEDESEDGVTETRTASAGEGVIGRTPSSLNANTAEASSEFRAVIGEEEGGVWLGEGEAEAVRRRLRPVSGVT